MTRNYDLQPLPELSQKVLLGVPRKCVIDCTSTSPNLPSHVTELTVSALFISSSEFKELSWNQNILLVVWSAGCWKRIRRRRKLLKQEFMANNNRNMMLNNSPHLLVRNQIGDMRQDWIIWQERFYGNCSLRQHFKWQLAWHWSARIDNIWVGSTINGLTCNVW